MVIFLKIDEDTLRDVVNMGFNKDDVCESLCSRLQNEVWTCKMSLALLLVTWLLIFAKYSRQLLRIIYYWTIGLEQPVAISGQIIKNQWSVYIYIRTFKQDKQ